MSKPCFQFPLILLAWGETPRVRLDGILDYCRMEAGQRELREKSSAGAAIHVPPRCGVSADIYRAWHLGGDLSNITGGDPGTAQRQHEALEDFASARLHPFVRIRREWFWNCFHGLRGDPAEKPLSYREFTVLCAILSKIGTKKSSPCTWQEIRRRALGYVTEAELQRCLPGRKDGASPWSRQQIRATLEKLEVNKFFAHFTAYAGRAAVRSHYSFSMDRGKLGAIVAEKFGRRRKQILKALRQRDRETCKLFAIVSPKPQTAGAATSPLPANLAGIHPGSHG